MPVIVMADLSNCLNPSIGTIRCLIRRLHHACVPMGASRGITIGFDTPLGVNNS
jgi:hypothetical protein